jgi:hypothetical protein
MISDYHKRVECQADGWPTGYSARDKEQLTSAVHRLLADGCPRSLSALYDGLYSDPRTPAIYREAKLYDYIYASLDRAARAVEKTEVGYWIAYKQLGREHLAILRTALHNHANHCRRAIEKDPYILREYPNGDSPQHQDLVACEAADRILKDREQAIEMANVAAAMEDMETSGDS